MDTDRLLELAPHYIAMLALVFLVLELVAMLVGDIGFLTELAIIIVIVFAYRPVVIRLGVAPSGWQ